MLYICTVQVMGFKNNLVLVTKTTNASSSDKSCKCSSLTQMWIPLYNGFLDGYTCVGVDNEIIIEPFKETRVRGVYDTHHSEWYLIQAFDSSYHKMNNPINFITYIGYSSLSTFITHPWCDHCFKCACNMAFKNHVSKCIFNKHIFLQELWVCRIIGKLSWNW